MKTAAHPVRGAGNSVASNADVFVVFPRCSELILKKFPLIFYQLILSTVVSPLPSSVCDYAQYLPVRPYIVDAMVVHSDGLYY